MKSYDKCLCTLDPSQTASDSFAYRSTMGMIEVVTILCVLLKLWSISVRVIYIVSEPEMLGVSTTHTPCRVNVMLCSSFSNSAVRESGGLWVMIMIIRGETQGHGMQVPGEGGVRRITKSHGSCWGRVSTYCNPDWPD